MKCVLWLIPALALVAGFSQTSIPGATGRESVVNSLRKSQQSAIEAFQSRNADRMISAYSADASLSFPNSPILQGEDLKTAIRAMAGDPNFSMQFTTDRVEVAKSGEIGYTRGTYTMTRSDQDSKKVVREQGKYVTIYSRQADGSWKMMEDISNADAPASAK
jgi:ketosteroid isomerase-like protein